MPAIPRSARIRAVTLTAATLVLIAGVVFACADSTSPDRSGTFFGPVTTIAGGSGRTYVVLDRVGAPTDLGVALTESALSGLPIGPAEYMLLLPPEASATVYKLLVINWQATGHGAPGSVYAVPHFDFHFYMVDEAVRASMMLGDAALTAKMVRPPEAAFIPAGYVAGNAIAQMGMHWSDPASPELNGQPFVRTFLYGSYDGVFMLTEPMVTRAYLETKPANGVTAIKLPASYAKSGYQPTSYSIGYDAGAKEYRIALTGLVKR